jgi:diguanylate cyclase (GGDEF)-like protein
MSYVILLSGEDCTPARGLVEALRGAGVSFESVASSAEAVAQEAERVREERGAGPEAVLFDVPAGSELTELHAWASCASDAWPGVPLVACRRESSNAGARGAQRFDESTLKRAGFHAIAVEAAQLSALLRDVEEHGADEDEARGNQSDFAPASLLLPERLSVERWTLYIVGDAGSYGDAPYEPLAVRGLTRSERRLPEGDWRRALLGDTLSLAGSESKAARAAVGSADTVRRKEGERRVVAVPLVSGERVTGVLEAVREGESARAFSRGDASLLSALSLPLAAALSNSARVAEAERLSQTDDLTKLHNARYLRQYLVTELKRARRYNSSVTAFFLDLDDFKSVNDCHGHLVGSHVLMEMAGVILASVRDTDVVARYGGDEFVVVLPETGMEMGLRVAERVRERIERHAFTGGRGLRLRLTASFGVASFPAHAQSPQQLIASADTAMYEAKASSKNCVRFAAETAQDA